jgi:HK97 family phage portal protein
MRSQEPALSLIDRIISPALQRFLEGLNRTTNSFQTNAGQTIDSDSPFELVAFRSAINVLSQDVATLPLRMYVKSGRARIDVTDHPLALALRLVPNPRMTAYEFREAMMVSLLTWGNFYAYLMRDNKGRVTAMYPLRPDRVTVTLDEAGLLLYTYSPADVEIEEQQFIAYEVLHIKGLSTDGLVGRSPLYDYREKMGEIAAAERFTQSFYGNGMKRSAVLSHPKTLSSEAQARLEASVKKQAGSDKAFGVLILEEGMDFSELSFAPEDAQLLESRRFSVEDSCRIFNLPPYKLRINEAGTVSYASVDAQHIDYLISSLTPWLVRIEQGIMRCCLSPAEVAGGMFVEHNTRALLRSDLKSQAEALKIGREANWYSPNDCREYLGENPIPDPRADDYFAPVQFTVQASPAEQADEPIDRPDVPLRPEIARTERA